MDEKEFNLAVRDLVSKGINGDVTTSDMVKWLEIAKTTLILSDLKSQGII